MRRILLILVCAVLTAGAWAQVVRAPDFAGGEWIDAGEAGKKVPHSIKGYRGQVLIVDFWEYTCINCIRDFAVLKRWYTKYHPYGFEVIGVHYGEFPMGFKVENVKRAAKRFQLPWPVVADPNGTIWNAYHSEAWPNRYLINQDGDIVMHIEGEGQNEEMEQTIRELLQKTHPEIAKIPLDPPENTFTPQCGITTQETYVGDRYGRGAVANSQSFNDGAITNFHAEREPKDGTVILDGKWFMAKDGVTSQSKEAKAELRYHARSVYAVLSVDNPKKPVRLNVLQDGKPLAKDAAGADVKFDAQGSYIEVSDPRMYYIVKNPEFGSHLLTLQPVEKDLSLHSYTYGNNCQQNFEER